LHRNIAYFVYVYKNSTHNPQQWYLAEVRQMPYIYTNNC
jgi:hypothetical protein